MEASPKYGAWMQVRKRQHTNLLQNTITSELTLLIASYDCPERSLRTPGGTSTSYLTIDCEQRHLIAVNYWDLSLVVIPLLKETGKFGGPVQSVYYPRHGRAMLASAKKDGGTSHSMNDASTIAQRQVNPHSHALVLDPFEGCVAYVPDLGKDLVREFWYDQKEGRIGCQFNVLPSGMSIGLRLVGGRGRRSGGSKLEAEAWMTAEAGGAASAAATGAATQAGAAAETRVTAGGGSWSCSVNPIDSPEVLPSLSRFSSLGR